MRAELVEICLLTTALKERVRALGKHFESPELGMLSALVEGAPLLNLNRAGVAMARTTQVFLDLHSKAESFGRLTEGKEAFDRLNEVSIRAALVAEGENTAHAGCDCVVCKLTGGKGGAVIEVILDRRRSRDPEATPAAPPAAGN